MKKIISVFLAVLMIAGCMAIGFSASADDTITINITIKEPKAGEAPDLETITITPIKYAKYFTAIYYRNDTDQVNDPATFEAGKVYTVSLNFNFSDCTDNGDDYASLAYHSNFIINGKLASREYIMDGAVLVTYTFDALQSPAEAPVCAWCGGDHSNGFFQMIIGWIHGILANIFGAKF